MHVVKQHRKNYWRRKKKNDLIDAYYKRITEHLPKLAVRKEFGEMSESNPLALPYPRKYVEIFEGNYNTTHGKILKADVEQNAGKKEQIQISVSLYLSPVPSGEFLLPWKCSGHYCTVSKIPKTYTYKSPKNQIITHCLAGFVRRVNGFSHRFAADFIPFADVIFEPAFDWYFADNHPRICDLGKVLKVNSIF